MENFNKDRFLAYGRWDLVINKSLYKNALITTIVLFLAITILGFLSAKGMYALNGSFPFMAWLNTFSWLSNARKLVVAIMAGYMFHNMLTHNSRITELTLPASKQEKFLWHILMYIGAPLLACWVCILVCDGLFAILTAIFMDSSMIRSYIPMMFGAMSTDDFVSLIQMNIQTDNINVQCSNPMPDFLLSIFDRAVDFVSTWGVISGITEYILITGLFAFINSIKYKHNIPLAFIINVVLGILMITGFVIVIFVGINNLSHGPAAYGVADITPEINDMVDGIFTTVACTSVISGIIGLICWYWTWKMYSKSQLTSAANK